MNNGFIAKSCDGLLVFFFVAIIFSPLVVMVVTDDEKFSEHEKRVLTTFPIAPKAFDDLLSYPHRFEKYYNDHFGFREKMIYRYNRELSKRFGVAGSSNVIQGQGNWLFYTTKTLLGDFLGNTPLTSDELYSWREKQKKRKEWLHKRGVAYLTFSPPNKQSVYPEKMPEGYVTVKGVSRLDQLLQSLEKDPMPFVIDVQAPLIKAKSSLPLYHETDTHWNRYGAFIAFKEVMKGVKKLFPETSFKEDFTFSPKLRNKLGGDLAKMLMIQKKVRDPYPPLRRYKKCRQSYPYDLPLTNEAATKHHKPYVEGCPSATLKAVIFCDSFITYLRPFLSENFSEILYLRKRYNYQNLEELFDTFQPDIVFEELVERNYFKTDIPAQ